MLRLPPIIHYPDPVLREAARAVVAIDDGVRNLAAQMRDVMLHEAGVGLAAPQIGRRLRLLVADVSERRNRPIALANPLILEQSDTKELHEEGCLSIPGMRLNVRRSACVVVRGIDMNEKEVTLECDGQLAVCMQHEIDHLNGVLFFDHVSRFKRDYHLAKYNRRCAKQKKSQKAA